MYTRAKHVEASPSEVSKMLTLTRPVHDEYAKRAGSDGEIILKVSKEYVEAAKKRGK